MEFCGDMQVVRLMIIVFVSGFKSHEESFDIWLGRSLTKVEKLKTMSTTCSCYQRLNTVMSYHLITTIIDIYISIVCNKQQKTNSPNSTTKTLLLNICLYKKVLQCFWTISRLGFDAPQGGKSSRAGARPPSCFLPNGLGAQTVLQKVALSWP